MQACRLCSPIFHHRPNYANTDGKMSARDKSCTTGMVRGCQKHELIVSWHVWPKEARAGGGFIPLGAARSSAGVSDLVIRLWGRATQRKSPLNSEEALKACSSPHQKRRSGGKKGFFCRCRLRYSWPVHKRWEDFKVLRFESSLSLWDFLIEPFFRRGRGVSKSLNFVFYTLCVSLCRHY